MAFKELVDTFYGPEYPRTRLERQLESAVNAARRGACVRVMDGKNGHLYRGQNLNSAKEHVVVDGVIANHFRDGDWFEKLNKAFNASLWGDEPKRNAEAPKWHSANDDILGSANGDDDDTELVEAPEAPVDQLTRNPRR